MTSSSVPAAGLRGVPPRRQKLRDVRTQRVSLGVYKEGETLLRWSTDYYTYRLLTIKEGRSLSIGWAMLLYFTASARHSIYLKAVCGVVGWWKSIIRAPQYEWRSNSRRRMLTRISKLWTSAREETNHVAYPLRHEDNKRYEHNHIVGIQRNKLI